MKFSNEVIEREILLLTDRLKLNNFLEHTRFPKYFEVETIRACNARCNMCPVWKLNDRGNVMSDELFSKMVEEMKNYSDWIERVCLSRNGEPLLDKKLPERIKMLKDIGIREISFSTNASLLDEGKSISLINSGLDDIRFSIDGVTKETFESIRVGLDFNRVVENCLRFIELRDKFGTKPKIHIRMVLQKANQHEEQEFNDFWKSKLSEKDVVTSKQMHSWGAQLENYESDENEEQKYSDTPCISLFGTMIIHYDGKVPLCGCDFDNKILLGDLNQSAIKNIWNSEKLNNIRKQHTVGERNDILLCKGCNIWDLEIKKTY